MLFNKKTSFTVALNTGLPSHRLSESGKIDLIARFSRRFGGATLTEHLGGYVMQDGTVATEYSYTIEVIGARRCDVKAAALDLGRENGQESILVGNSLVYC